LSSPAARRRIVFLAAAAVGLWLATAAIGHYVLGAFSTFGDAVWSGLRHLLDPGALADDVTAAERAIGVLQLLIGLVFIVGVLIAVLEQAVTGSLRRLAEGDPRVRWSNHVVIVGWNRLVPEVVTQFARVAGDRAAIAVVVPSRLRGERPEIETELARRARAASTRVIAGDPGSGPFERAGVTRARAIVVASGRGAGQDDPDAADLGTISACLAVREALRDSRDPAVLPLLHRGQNVDAVSRHFPGSWEYVVADRVAAGVAAAALERPQLTPLLAGGFNRITPSLVRPLDPDAALEGRRFSDLLALLPRALPVGVARASGELVLVPDADELLGPGDRVLAVGAPDGSVPTAAQGAAAKGSVRVALAPPPTTARRVLHVGPRASLGALTEALGDHSGTRFELEALGLDDPGPAAANAPGNVDVRWRRGDPADPAVLASALEDARPGGAIVAADPQAYGEAADARALLTCFHIARCDAGGSMPILADVLADTDAPFGGDDQRIQLISRGSAIARWTALLLTDPLAARATATLVAGREAHLGAYELEVSDRREVTFSSAYLELIDRGAIPIGLIGSDGLPIIGPAADRRLSHGQWMIAIRRSPAS
jgi:hypothetical protein